jgi:Domain of unknown function (DUF4835)
MLKPYFFFLTCLLVSFTTMAQELQCKVEVNAPSIQQTDQKVFQALKTSVEEFMNNTKWTNDEWLTEEKIPVSIAFNIVEDKDQQFFKAELTIQSTRPVYGSNYTTPLLNHIDKDVSFEYQQSLPLLFTRNATNTNLVSILSFYAFMVLGYDYDSFELNGGSPYFKDAWSVVQSMNNASGWNADKSLRNRYWMCENMLSNRSTDFHKAVYTYHRLGLDIAATDVIKARGSMITALEDVQKTSQAYFQSMMVQLFTQAKQNEIIEVFKQGTPEEKAKINVIIPKIDPANASKYRQQIGQ